MDSDFWASRILVAWDPSRVPVNWLGPNAQDCVSGVRWELVPPFLVLCAGIRVPFVASMCALVCCSRSSIKLVAGIFVLHCNRRRLFGQSIPLFLQMFISFLYPLRQTVLFRVVPRCISGV